jgi:hypothetical protein
MLPQTHFLLPFLIVLGLTKFNILSWKLALISGIIAVVIDLDHLVEHFIHSKKNKLSIFRTWNNSMKYHKFSQRSLIHHWQGFLIITGALLIILIFNWQSALILAIAYYSHLLLDYIHLKRDKYLRFKIGRFFIKETHTEIIIDILLIKGIILLFWF